MAFQSLSALNVMAWKDTFYWLRDRVWTTLEYPTSKKSVAVTEWSDSLAGDVAVIEAAYNLLKDELKTEDDRMRIVETKLLSIASFAPIAMTITVAIVTFLTGGKVREFTRPSILIVGFGGGYVALQFLRAVLAAINGLERRSYSRILLTSIVPGPREEKEAYLKRACKEMIRVITENKEVINEKVSQLALGHTAIKNAVWGLLLVLITILIITITTVQPS